MIPIDAEHMQAIRRGAEHSRDAGDLETAEVLHGLYALWGTIVTTRGGTTGSGPLAAPSAGRSTAPFLCNPDESVGQLDPWSRRVPCE